MHLHELKKGLQCLGATHLFESLLRSAKRRLLAVSVRWETKHISESPLLWNQNIYLKVRYDWKLGTKNLFETELHLKTRKLG
jgi:hypothetical protein